MTDRRRIEYRTDMDSKGFERGSRTVLGRLQDMGRGLQRHGVVGFGQLSQAVGMSGTDLVRFGVRAGEAIWNLAQTGEAAERVAASFSEVFGPAAERLREAMDDTRRAMGLGRAEFESIVIPIGQMATNAGFAGEEAADLGGKLVTLAGDVAAFNPLVGDSNQALGAMQAALRGEFDPLERFGSKLSAARVKAEGARLRGIDPLNASLSDQQVQIMAVVSLLGQDFAPAMGTLEDSADTATTKANELTASMKDLQSVVASALTGPVGRVADVVADTGGAAAGAAGDMNIFKIATEQLGNLIVNQLFGPTLLWKEHVDGWGEAAEGAETRVVPSFNGIGEASRDAADRVLALKGAVRSVPNEWHSTLRMTFDIDETKLEYVKGKLAELGVLVPPGLTDIGFLAQQQWQGHAAEGASAAASAEESGRRYQDDIDRWNQANGDGPGIG